MDGRDPKREPKFFGAFLSAARPFLQRVDDKPALTATAQAAAGSAAAPATAATVSGGLGLVDVRRLWPDVLDAVKVMRRYAWVMLSQNASVHSLDGTTLTIALVNAGARDSFVGNGANEILRQALIDKLGVDWRVEAIVDPSAGSSPQPDPGAQPGAATPVRQQPVPPSAAPRPAPDPEATAAARGAIRPTRTGQSSELADSVRQSDAAVHPDDPSADPDPVGHDELLARELGAEVIEEIPHER